MLQGIGYSALKTPQRKVVTLAVLLGAIYVAKKKGKKNQDQRVNNQTSSKDQAPKKKGGKGNVDKLFWERVI